MKLQPFFQSYYFVRPRRSRGVRFGHGDEAIERLVLIERHDLIHAAHAELLAVGLCVRCNAPAFWIGPAEHCHHLALGTVGVSSGLRARFTNPMTALLRLVDAG